MAIAGNFSLNFEIEPIFLLMDIYMASPRGFYKGLEEFLAPFVDKYAQTKEKADSLLYSLNQN